jgi:hypothetical protein
LAIAGFSLLGVIVIAILGLSGQGVRDLRSQVFAAVTTLVATIAGFYFGAQTAKGTSAAEASPPASAPKLGPDPRKPKFTVGVKGSYVPTLTGTPAPTVSLAEGSSLPSWLHLDSGTGAITGTPVPDAAPDYEITLIAKNGISPDAQLPVKLSIVPAPEAPKLGPDPKNLPFAVGAEGTYAPTLTGTPAPAVSLAEGSTLPSGLQLDTGTGAITGTPAPGTVGDHDVTLIAKNGISPDAQLTIKLTIV